MAPLLITLGLLVVLGVGVPCVLTQLSRAADEYLKRGRRG